MKAFSKEVLFAVVLSASSLGLAGCATSDDKMAPADTAAASDAAPAGSANQSWMAFSQADQDGNGAVDSSEAAAVQGLDFAAADANGDGSLNQSEYEAAVKALPSDSGSQDSGAVEQGSGGGSGGSGGGGGY